MTMMTYTTSVKYMRSEGSAWKKVTSPLSTDFHLIHNKLQNGHWACGVKNPLHGRVRFLPGSDDTDMFGSGGAIARGGESKWSQSAIKITSHRIVYCLMIKTDIIQ